MEISDPLLRDPRKLAEREGVTPRAIVERGLRRVVAETLPTRHYDARIEAPAVSTACANSGRRIAISSVCSGDGRKSGGARLNWRAPFNPRNSHGRVRDVVKRPVASRMQKLATT